MQDETAVRCGAASSSHLNDWYADVADLFAIDAVTSLKLAASSYLACATGSPKRS